MKAKTDGSIYMKVPFFTGKRINVTSENPGGKLVAETECAMSYEEAITTLWVNALSGERKLSWFKSAGDPGNAYTNEHMTSELLQKNSEIYDTSRIVAAVGAL